MGKNLNDFDRLIGEDEQTERLVITIIGSRHDVAIAAANIRDTYSGFKMAVNDKPVKHDETRYSTIIILEPPKRTPPR